MVGCEPSVREGSGGWFRWRWLAGSLPGRFDGLCEGLSLPGSGSDSWLAPTISQPLPGETGWSSRFLFAELVGASHLSGKGAVNGFKCDGWLAPCPEDSIGCAAVESSGQRFR